MTTNTVKKYNFKDSFDSNERGIVTARDFTLEDMEVARSESLAEGKALGMAEARETIEQNAANALGTIGTRLSELSVEIENLKSRIESEALESVLCIARKLLPHYAETHGLDEIEGITRDCLTAVYDEPRIVIRAHETVLDHIKGRLDDLITTSGFSGKAVLFADQSLGLADCRIEWADGGTERDIQRLWCEIEENISRFLDREVKSKIGDQPNLDSGGQKTLGE